MVHMNRPMLSNHSSVVAAVPEPFWPVETAGSVVVSCSTWNGLVHVFEYQV